METGFTLFKSGTAVASVLYFISGISYFIHAKRIGSFLILIGLTVNIAILVMRGHVAGDWYLDLMFTEGAELLVLPAGMACVVLFLLWRGADTEGLIVMIPLVITSIIPFVIPEDVVLPSLKAQVLVAPLFFLTEALSAAFFFSAGVLAFASLLFGLDSERVYSRFILWGFLVFTLCQIIGAVWAYIGWSYPFSWSSRHLTSTSIWCIYAALIHVHLTKTRQGIRAVCATLGCVPMIYIIYHHEIVEAIRGYCGC